MTTVHNFFLKPVKYMMQERGKVMDGDETVSEAVEFMKKCGAGFVIVKLDDGKLGAVSENDLVLRVIGGAMDPKKTRLKEVATKSPVTINQNASLELALKLMRDRNVRQLIVVDDKNAPVGGLDQKFFFCSFVNVATGSDDSEGQSWVTRYIHEIVDHNVTRR